MSNHHNVVASLIGIVEKSPTKKEVAETNLHPPLLSGETIEIPVEIITADNISSVEKLVFVGLKNLNVEVTKLASILNMSRNTVAKAVKNLEKHNYIKVKNVAFNKRTFCFFDEDNKKTENPDVSPLNLKMKERIKTDEIVATVNTEQPSLLDYISNTFQNQVPKTNISQTALKILVERLNKPKEWYEELFKATQEQLPYLTGENRNRWCMSINWLLTEVNAQKVLDRQYVR